MPRTTAKPRVCRRCRQPHHNRKIRHCVRCGHEMWRPRWRMTKRRIQAVHAKALGQKGLDEETYRLRLESMGLDTCKTMSRDQYNRFMRALNRLPDRPGWQPRGRRA